MTEADTLVRAAPRRRDAAATRQAILDAAVDRFARLGYDRASLREIAAEAGADVALVNRYFGGKEALFLEALRASFKGDLRQTWNRTTFAHDIAEMMADGPHADEARTQSFQFLLRAAASPTTAPLLSVALQERFLSRIVEWLGGDNVAARARVLAAVVIGFLVERLVRDEPLTGAERAAFVDRARRTVEALLAD